VDELIHIARRMRRIALQSAVGIIALSIRGKSFLIHLTGLAKTARQRKAPSRNQGKSANRYLQHGTGGKPTTEGSERRGVNGARDRYSAGTRFADPRLIQIGAPLGDES
jgi:hypothetical protein